MREGCTWGVVIVRRGPDSRELAGGCQKRVAFLGMGRYGRRERIERRGPDLNRDIPKETRSLGTAYSGTPKMRSSEHSSLAQYQIVPPRHAVPGFHMLFINISRQVFIAQHSSSFMREHAGLARILILDFALFISAVVLASLHLTLLSILTFIAFFGLLIALVIRLIIAHLK